MALEEERPISMITVLGSADEGISQGDRLLVKPDGTTHGSLGDGSVDAAATEVALEQLEREVSEIRTLPGPGEVRAFVEVLEPPLRLVICGAGHDAVPLVRAVAGLGWSAIVVDDRPAFLTRERFPDAAGFVPVQRPDETAVEAPLDPRTYAIVMTHNFLRDKDYLRALLGSPARFIAMLGPAARTQRILLDLREEGLELSEDDLARIHAPAGLDLGSEGPEEIAAAIVAEIVAVKRGREGGFLRDRSGPIHERSTPARSTSA
jgi:xanthine dehydrogenase accessory factor